ncbi:MAG: GUN4 domain-containing protein [Synechococcales bacterium]|nr:GUN4 domain-containing protein [Synechococcales bacterium]
MTDYPMTSGAPQNSPDPKDQLAEMIVKVLMTGGIGAGSIGAFWSLFKDSDVPKAIASAAIGVAITYGAKLLSPLHQGTERRLEATGKAIDGKIDNFIEDLQTRGADDPYLQLQKEDCQTSLCDGITQVFTPLLEEIFVPLSMTFTDRHPGWMNELNEWADNWECLGNSPSSQKDTQIWQWLKQAETDSKQGVAFRRMAILAWGGYGKTTLLRHIAYIYSSKQHRRYGVNAKVPIFLPLKTYGKLVAKTPALTLPEVVMQHHVPHLSRDLALPENWAIAKLKAGEAVLLLDGLDEVKEDIRPQVAQWLKRELREYPKSIAILTSRPKAYDEQPIATKLEMRMRIWVEPFNTMQQERFIKDWYQYQESYANHGRSTSDVTRRAEEKAVKLLGQIRERPEIEDLAKIPLLLNMIATFHRLSPNVQLPKRKVDLYQAICKLQLVDRPGAKELETLLTETNAQTILQKLALEMVLNDREKTVEQGVLVERLARYLTAENEAVDAREFLQEVVRVSELLVEKEVGEYEFAHWSFQEYLAAKEIFDRQPDQFVIDRLMIPEWKPLILMYSSLLKNPSALIRSMLDQNLTDLARAALQETTKKVDPAIEQELERLSHQVTHSTYTKLEALLKAGNWKEADQETFKVMLEVAGKTDRGYLDPEDLEHFPCEDLLTIDRLWVEASDGHFGFSVQKKIWEKCGSPMDYNDDYKKFLEKVGWQRGGNWVGYDDLMFSPSLSLAGELPWGEVGEVWGWWVFLWFLFSRAATCEL